MWPKFGVSGDGFTMVTRFEDSKISRRKVGSHFLVELKVYRETFLTMNMVFNLGGGLLIYYHGGLPVDYYDLKSHIICEKKRLLRTVADKLVCKVGWLNLLSGLITFNHIVNLLKGLVSLLSCQSIQSN